MRLSRSLSWGIVILTLLLWSRITHGQTGSETSRQGTGVSLEVQPPLSQVHVPGRWSQLPIRVNNERAAPFSGLCAISLGDDQSLQFGRRIEVPPRSSVTSWQPILIPPDIPRSSEQVGIQEFEFRALLFETDSSGDRLVQDDTGHMQFRGAVWLAHPGPVTGVINAPPQASSTDYFQPISPELLVSTTRVQKGQRHNLVVFEQSFLPGGEESLDGYDQLVIADDLPLQDPSSIQAVRRWLYGGGRLWVMLDQVSPSLLANLLGDDFNGQIVDRVSLTSLHIQAGPDMPPVDERPQDRDHPVEFLRLLIEGVQVDFTVDGWPASYSQTCGEGRLFVTTLGLDGWVRPRTERDDPPPTGDVWQTEYVPGGALEELTLSFFKPRPSPRLSPSVLEQQSRESIGYSIPSRGLVVGILSAFAISLVMAGIWLTRIGEAQRLALFGPAVTIVASLALMGVGRLHRSMPAMTAVSQFVRPIPGTTDVRATGSAAMFVSEAGDLQLSGDAGGWLMPESANQEGTTRRLVWSGINHWSWENIEQPAGLQSASLYAAAEMKTLTLAHASFDAAGVIGSLHLPAGLMASDPVIVTPSGRMAVEINETGEFFAQGNDVLTGDNFYSAGLLSDEQTNRAEVLSALFHSPDAPYSPDYPTLFFWTAPWDLGMNYPTDSSLTGSALVTLPLRLERPTADNIFIPSPFLQYREVASPGGEMPSGLYDYRKHQWQQRSRPSSATLRFQVPRELGAVQLSEARMAVRVVGPMGRLEVSAVKDDTLIPIDTWIDPVGEIRLQWDDPDLLQIDESGGLRLHLAMGDPERPELTQGSSDGNVNYFQVESLIIDLQATVVDGSAPAN